MSVFAQISPVKDIKKQKKYYAGTWYANTYIIDDQELSDELAPSIELFFDGTYRFSSSLTSYNGKWKLKNKNIITLVHIDHYNNNEKTEVYNLTPEGLLLTNIIGNGHKNSTLSLGIKIIYGKSGGKTCPGIPTVEYKGKIYHTVQIGNQCWLQENLDVGTMIKGEQEQKDNGIIEKYCYNDDPKNCIKYGGLYQWNEAMQYSRAKGSQGICPSGWHILTKDEFQSLALTVNNNGNTLKAQGQGMGGGAGTNTSGFSGLFAGYRSGRGGFSEVGVHSYFWTCAETDSGSVFNMHLGGDSSSVDLYYYGKNDGFSVRCVKN